MTASGELINGQRYRTEIPTRDTLFANEVVRHVRGPVRFESDSSPFIVTLINFFPFLVFGLLLFLIMRSAQRRK